MSKPFQTDALSYRAGPSSSLGQPKSLGSSTRPFDIGVGDLTPGARYEAELKRVHEGWNGKIDKEVKGLAKGLRDLVDLADIGSNPTSTPSPLPLQLRLSSLIRSTQNLRDMTHELKLLLLLSDQASSVSQRDAEVRMVREEVERKREEVGEEIVNLIGARAPARRPESKASAEHSTLYPGNGQADEEGGGMPVDELGRGQLDPKTEDEDEDEEMEEI